MQKKQLYRVVREDGGITHTPNRPNEAGYTIMYRLIADEGMILVNGDIQTYCVDVDEVDGWEEIKEPTREEEENGAD